MRICQLLRNTGCRTSPCRIGTSHDLAEPTANNSVITVSHTVRNHEGHIIALCHDAPRQAQATLLPIVLLCPGYGMTQQAYVAFAYLLAESGLRVLRYDHSCHLGLSDGDPAQTTFTSLEDDLDTVLAFTQKMWPGASLTMVASDILGRIALRRQDWHRLIRRLILINPTLDLRNCLSTLHQRDLVQEHLAGIRFGLGNLLGIPLDIDRFLADAIAAQYTDVTALRNDLTHCDTEVVIVTASPEASESTVPGNVTGSLERCDASTRTKRSPREPTLSQLDCRRHRAEEPRSQLATSPAALPNVRQLPLLQQQYLPPSHGLSRFVRASNATSSEPSMSSTPKPGNACGACKHILLKPWKSYQPIGNISSNSTNSPNLWTGAWLFSTSDVACIPSQGYSCSIFPIAFALKRGVMHARSAMSEWTSPPWHCMLHSLRQRMRSSK